MIIHLESLIKALKTLRIRTTASSRSSVDQGLTLSEGSGRSMRRSSLRLITELLTGTPW